MVLNPMVANRKLFRFLDRWSLQGTSPRYPEYVNKKIMLTNLLGGTCVIVALAYLPVFWFFFPSPAVTWISAGIAPSLALSLLLIRFGFPYAGRLLFILLANTAVFLLADGLDRESGVHLIYFPLTAASLILFDVRERFSILALAPVAPACFLLLLHSDFDLIFGSSHATPEAQAILHTLLIPTALGLLFINVYALLKIHHRYEERNRILRQMVDTTSDMILIVDADTCEIADANPSAIQNLGRPLQEMLSLKIGDIAPTIKGASDLERHRKQSKSDGKPSAFELLYQKRDGSSLPVEVEFASIVSDDRRYFILSAHDTTEQKQAINLQKLAAMGELSGGIAHEINTPIGTVVLVTEQLRTAISTQPIDLDLAHKMLDILERAGSHIARTVKTLKAFFGQSGDTTLSPTDLHSVVQNAVILSAEKARRRDVNLDIHWDSLKYKTVAARPHELTQVLINLIGNAIDAVEPLEERWLRIDAADTDTGVDLAVTDSGKGIPPEIRSRIFDSHFSTKPIGKGTGFGLSFSKKIVESHKAEILVDEFSSNTRFVIRFPRYGSQEQEHEQEQQEAA